MVYEARELLKQLYNCCDLIDEMLPADGKTKTGLREVLLSDTVLFVTRILSNDSVTEREAAFLNALTGKENTAEVWLCACKEMKDDVPEAFSYFVRADKAIMRRHTGLSRGASMTESLYRYFCAVGDALVLEDPSAEEAVRAETERISVYLKTAFDNDPELC